MKYILRVFLFNTFALWITTEIVPGIRIQGDILTTLLGGGILSILMLIVKPMLKILFIPFNFLTFGIAGLFINVVVIYLLTLLFPEIQIVPFTFPGFSWQGFVIPSIKFNYFGSLLAVTGAITLISHLLHSVSES